MAENIKDAIIERREHYGITQVALEGVPPQENPPASEIAEYLKYKELDLLEKQNEHLGVIRNVLIWSAFAVLVLAAIGSLILLISCIEDIPLVGFVSFVMMFIFSILAWGVLGYRQK